MKVIWLCSWYPNTEDKFRGDFIQRQALAVSLYVKIEVVHIVFCNRTEHTVTCVNENLVENIFYIQRTNKLSDWKQYFQRHSSFLQNYISQNGKPDLVHVQLPIPAGIPAWWWSWQYDIPYVLTEHYGIYNRTVADHFKTRSFLFRHFTKKVIKGAKYFLPVSKILGTEVNDMVLEKDFIDIPNVVDTTLFYYNASKPAGKFKFVHVSNMAGLKNVKGILEAIRILAERRNDFEFLLIGNKPTEEVALAQQLGILNQTCFFIDEISYPEVASYVRGSHAGVLFSTTESQSCVVLEWLCSGLPVISSAVGGVVELINPENGILIESGDVNALAEAMKHVLDNYLKYDFKAIAENAKALYSYDSVGMQVYNIYEKCTR